MISGVLGCAEPISNLTRLRFRTRFAPGPILARYREMYATYGA